MRENNNDFFDFDMDTNIFEKLENDKISIKESSNNSQKLLNKKRKSNINSSWSYGNVLSEEKKIQKIKETKKIKKNINNYNSLSIINSPENTKKEKIKFKRKKNRRDILNKSANNNSKNKIEKKEYDFIIPKKYLNKEYKLNNTIKESDKIINIYSLS